MSRTFCALAADTKVETPEGALTVKTLVGKAISVFTREAAGRARFRMTSNARKIAEAQPVLKIVIESGAAFRVGADQVLFKSGMVECHADQLRIGDDLEAAFHYPQGYEFHDDLRQATEVSRQAWRVTSIEAAGTADLYSLAVRETGCFFLAAGVLGKAESA